MKKDIVFTPVLLLVAALLFAFRLTGIGAHIAVSVVGILALAMYTAATKKEWKIPALEIIMRVAYGIALISGIVTMNVNGVPAIAIAHKAFAGLFTLLLVILFVHKLVSKKTSK